MTFFSSCVPLLARLPEKSSWGDLTIASLSHKLSFSSNSDSPGRAADWAQGLCCAALPCPGSRVSKYLLSDGCLGIRTTSPSAAMCLAVVTNQGWETKEWYQRTRPQGGYVASRNRRSLWTNEVKTHMQIWGLPLQEDGRQIKITGWARQNIRPNPTHAFRLS